MDIIKLMLLSRQIKNRRREKNNKVSGIPPLTFTAKKTGTLKNYRIYGNTVNGESVGDLVTDSQSEHYGEYAIPITNNSEIANIYLNEPLRMVGDETEYVDYETQKWHRVRKNLLPKKTVSYSSQGILVTNESDGTFSVNGIATDTIFIYLANKRSYPFDTILNGCPQGGSSVGYLLRAVAKTPQVIIYTDFGNGVLIPANTEVELEVRVQNGAECNYLKFKPMIRKADIIDDTYETYIKNTEVDVILPGIAVTAGTNTLTVGTEIQPSRVELTGRIKEGES